MLDLIGINGRIGRLHYWVGSLIGTVITGLAVSLIGEGLIANLSYLMTFNIRMLPGGLVFILALNGWFIFTLIAKRYHDRNKSAFWYFLVLIPIIGPIWQFIELGFLKGIDSSNDYGPKSGGSFKTGSYQSEVGSQSSGTSMFSSIDKLANQQNTMADPKTLVSQKAPRHRLDGAPVFGKRGLTPQ